MVSTGDAARYAGRKIKWNATFYFTFKSRLEKSTSSRRIYRTKVGYKSSLDDKEEGRQSPQCKYDVFVARGAIYAEAQKKHCRLVAVVGRGEHSVSSRARCVWLTSRPSWPLEGGRPPGGLPITRPVSATRTRPRSVIPSSTFERPCTAHRAVAEVEGREARTRGLATERRDRVCATGTHRAGDRIMFRYLYDAAHFSGLPPATHEERSPEEGRADGSRIVRLTCHCDRGTAQLNSVVHSERGRYSKSTLRNLIEIAISSFFFFNTRMRNLLLYELLLLRKIWGRLYLFLVLSNAV